MPRKCHCSGLGFASAHAALARVFGFQAIIWGTLIWKKGYYRPASMHEKLSLQTPNDPEARAITAWLRVAVGQGDGFGGIVADTCAEPELRMGERDQRDYPRFTRQQC